MALALLASGARADELRIASYATGLSRDGPGVLLDDLRKGKAEDAALAAATIRAVDPDILLLLDFDYDATGAALDAFAALIGEGAYPHRFARRPNTGMATGLDMDGDGRRGGPRDAQGYGEFSGQGGMAVLSRLPFDEDGFTDLSALLWTDLPGAILPRHPDGSHVHSPEALAVQRLSTTAHWDLPVILPQGRRLHLLAFHATPPAFDGTEDRNGKRAADELRLWTAYLDSRLPKPPPDPPFVILGISNIDPARGDGDRAAMAAFLADPRLSDPLPRDALGSATTADFPAPLGPLRVDYILPSRDLAVLASGLAPATEGGPVHRLVWVDLHIP